MRSEPATRAVPDPPRDPPGSPGGAPESPAAAAAFDGLAPSYDETFTDTALGRHFRRAVWRRLDRALGPGDRVLDLGCGTGEDALHLASRGVEVVGVDASREMVERAREKAEGAGLADRIRILRGPIEAVDAIPGLVEASEGEPFDGAISNFGALNCVEDLGSAARRLAALTRPGAPVLLCLMGRWVPWEWAWYLLRGEPRKAFRRLAPGGALWRGTRVRYPTVGTVRRAFSEGFRLRRTTAVGALLPPPYAEAWARRHPALVARLAGLERRLESVPPLPRLADHVLLELRRR